MSKSKNIGNSIIRIAVFSLILLLVNYISGEYFQRFDLTKEKRYTLSPSTKKLLADLDDMFYVSVYLEGDFPAGFKRLQNGTREMLEEFVYYSNGKIEFAFEDPQQDYNDEERQVLREELSKMGIKPTNLQLKDESGFRATEIFPGMVIFHRGRRVGVQLLENQLGQNSEEVLNTSVELLEYKLANGLRRAGATQQTLIAFTEGHGELSNEQLGDLSQSLSELQYGVSRIDMSQMISIPPSVNVLVVAKPVEQFSTKDKFKIDQYIMNGGSVLWLLDAVNAEMDSMRGKIAYMAQARDIELADQLFRYGFRLNSDLVQDIQCEPIPLVVGVLGDAPQTELFPWFYHPLVGSTEKHATVKGIDKVAMRFANTIDTVQRTKNNNMGKLTRIPLLQTSAYSKALFPPVRLHFSTVKEKPSKAQFGSQYLPVAWLAEGQFSSLFTNRLDAGFMKVYEDSIGLKVKDESNYARMIVVGDGDVASSDLNPNGGVFPLGFNRFSGNTAANMEFLLNCIEFLTDNDQLIEARNKELKIRRLDPVKIKEEKTKWQLIAVVTPIALVLLFGLGYTSYRRYKYTA